jgi:hypothetical protein
VSVVVIKSLSTLRVPLLSAAARAELLAAPMGGHAPDVCTHIVADVLYQLPPSQGRTLQVSGSVPTWSPLSC